MNFDAVSLPAGISGYLWRPVLAGLWRQNETFDGTYDVHDLIEVNKVLDVYEENQRRARRAEIEAAKTR